MLRSSPPPGITAQRITARRNSKWPLPGTDGLSPAEPPGCLLSPGGVSSRFRSRTSTPRAGRSWFRPSREPRWILSATSIAAADCTNVATVLSELAAQIDPYRLVMAAEVAPIPWVQRLGYLLERVGAADRAALLKAHVQQNAYGTIPLLPAAPQARRRRRPPGLDLQRARGRLPHGPARRRVAQGAARHV